jgi:LEA14-like dessication related protein
LSGLIALAVFVCWSCSPTIEKLEILRIENVRIDSITRNLIAMRAAVTVKNPYYSSAKLKNITFDVSFTDHPIAYGKLAGITEMKARQIITLGVPLVISCKDITQNDFQTFLQTGARFRVDGSAILESPFGPRTLAIHLTNRLPELNTLVLRLNQKAILDILSPDVSSAAELASLIRKNKLSMRLYNPFAFDLSVNSFRYEIRMGNRALANGGSEEPLQLRPGTNRFAVTVAPHPMALADNLLDLLITRTLPDLTLDSNFAVVNGEHSLKFQLLYSPAR